MLDTIDRLIIKTLHGGFPLSDEPYRDVASNLGINETDLLDRLQAMLDRRILTRFGPLFQIERMGGVFVLAAMAVPEVHYERVALLVNSLPEVAHNYRREHRLNMWFVLATETPAGIDAAIRIIEETTSLHVYSFPKEREYFVEMKLDA